MSLRLVEALVEAERGLATTKIISAHAPLSVTQEMLSGSRVLVRAVLSAENLEPLLDELEDELGDDSDFRVLLLAVEATLPRPREPSTAASPAATGSQQRVSREELYTELAGAARITPIFLTTVALSTVVAAIGLIRDSVAVIIGAMVIAPLLGPNMALALGCVLGDLRLMARAAVTSVAGMGVALALATLIGVIFGPAGGREIADRSLVQVTDVVLALAAGAAGAIAVSTGAPTALIGVMVAVALLPPLVAFGLLLARVDVEAAGAAVLLAINVTAIILAAVATFVAQGVRPRSTTEAGLARRATRTAVTACVALLAGFVALVVVVL